MRCPRCKAANPDGSKFCAGCGTSFRLSSDDGEPQVPAEDAPVPEPEPSVEPQETGNSSRPKSGFYMEAFTPVAMEEKTPSPGDGRSSGTTFCARCGGAFARDEMTKMERDWLCKLCVEKRESKKSGSFPPGMLPPDVGVTPPGGTKRPSSARVSVPAGPVPLSRIVFFVFFGLLFLGAAGVAVFFAFSDAGAPPPAPAPQPVPEPEPEVAKAPEPPPEPEPVPEPEPRSYEPRAFTGVFQGVNATKGAGAGALVFVDAANERILVAGPENLSTLFQQGTRYKFTFKPTDEFYDTGVVSYHLHLLSRIEKAP